MSASITSAAQTVNVALERMGYAKKVGSLFDGSPAARAALTIFAQTRDELIRNGEWEFAERVVSGTKLKQAPAGGYVVTPWSAATNPAPPWQFEYAYPDDCLKVRSIRDPSVSVPNFRPLYNRFSVENDNAYNPARKVILCDVPGAIITYAAQITDPTTWEPDFVSEFAAALARSMATLKGSMNAQEEAVDEQMKTATAMDQRG